MLSANPPTLARGSATITPTWDDDPRAAVARMAEGRAMLRIRGPIATRPADLVDVPVYRQTEGKPRPRKGPRVDIPECPTRKVYVRRDCGLQPVRYESCKLPVCPTCESTRAAKLRDKWGDAISHINTAVSAVLTIESGDSAKERRQHLTTSARKVAELRLGSTGRRRLQAKAHAFIDSLNSESLGKHGTRNAADWHSEIDKWIAYAERREAAIRDQRPGARLKFRDMLRGILSIESTHNANGWHFHAHMLLDMRRFMPWPILVAAWTIATRQEQYAGAYMKAVDGPPEGELFKYALKPADLAELEDDQKVELINALYNAKRVHIFDCYSSRNPGGIRPTDPKREPCPSCGSETCHEHAICAAPIPEGMTGATFKARSCEAAHDDTGHTVMVTEYNDAAQPKLGRLWRADDTPNLSQEFPLLNTTGREHGTDPPRTATGPPAEPEYPETQVMAW